jgi:membrane protease YdiL (CAAX protease family)
MNKSTTRRIAAYAAVTLLFLFPYTVAWSWGWWKFLGSSLAIVSFWRLAMPGEVTRDLGIRLRRVDAFLGVSSLLAVGIIASYLIPGILRPRGYVAAPNCSLVWKCLATPFQTLNEEMVLRAMLLTALARIVKARLLISLSVATLFTVLHFALYRFGPPHVALSFQALTTLLLVGLAFNELFLATGSIAIPYGIHLGWNLTRFGEDFVEPGGYLGVGQDFNLIEGNSCVVALAAVLALIALAARARLSAYFAVTRHCEAVAPHRSNQGR